VLVPFGAAPQPTKNAKVETARYDFFISDFLSTAAARLLAKRPNHAQPLTASMVPILE
jgi:hypothetical protein